MDPWDEELLNSESQSSSLSASSSEPLTVDMLKSIMEELEAKHPTIRARRALSASPRLLFQEHLEVSTPAPWRDMYWYARIAAPPFPWWTGVSVIGETSSLPTRRESRTSRTLRGLWSLMLRLPKASSASRSGGRMRLWLHDHLLWPLRRYFRTRVW